MERIRALQEYLDHKLNTMEEQERIPVSEVARAVHRRIGTSEASLMKRIRSYRAGQPVSTFRRVPEHSSVLLAAQELPYILEEVGKRSEPPSEELIQQLKAHYNIFDITFQYPPQTF
jgi:hypothetical protein